MERKLSTIYLVMFRIGCVTYGGGWSIFAQLEDEFGEKRNWLSKEELLDIMSLARSFPGIMVINLSIMFGYKVRGAAGAVAAAFGLATPAFFVISAITCCYDVLMQNQWIARAMIGVRCSVVPIMLVAALRMRKTAMKGKLSWIFAVAALALCLFGGINKLVMVITAGILGLFIWGRKWGET